jgi:predicted transcriptional regulator
LTSFLEILGSGEPRRKRVLSVEDWAEIRRLRRSEQLSISEVARVMGVARNTVKAALASGRPPKYQRVLAGSIVDEVEPRIRELLAACDSSAWARAGEHRRNFARCCASSAETLDSPKLR